MCELMSDKEYTESVEKNISDNRKCFDLVEKITKDVLLYGQEVIGTFASYLFDLPYEKCLEYQEGRKSEERNPKEYVDRNYCAYALLYNIASARSVEEFYKIENLIDMILEKFPYHVSTDCVITDKDELVESAMKFIHEIPGYVMMRKRMFDECFKPYLI